MIRLRRPAGSAALSARTRTYLEQRSATARPFTPHDPRIISAWSSFLRARSRDDVARALDGYTYSKCAYCEQVAAADIEHFWPKTTYPARMFSWDNFLRGCKNCNNVKRDRFPLDDRGERLLIDPCEDEPLDHFFWDALTGATGVTPDPDRRPRAAMTRQLFQLDQEPLREERRNKLWDVLYLLARVIEENPVASDTRDRLCDHLLAHRPWLGIVRQLLLRPDDRYRPLVDQAIAKLPEIRKWAAAWL
jgi:uncharacterized protein (TIGR02646 family)